VKKSFLQFGVKGNVFGIALYHIKIRESKD